MMLKDSTTLNIMYNYKVQEADDFRNEFNGNNSKSIIWTPLFIEVLREYRSGALDPGRLETKYEMLLQKKKKQQMIRLRRKMFKNKL